MNNIGQFTEESDLSETRKQINIQVPDDASPSGGKSESFYVQYKMFSQKIFGANVIKISYCCEPAAQYFPIIINGNVGADPNMYVGKNGMLEYQGTDSSPVILLPVNDKYIYLPICFSKNTTKPDQKFKQTLDFVLEV